MAAQPGLLIVDDDEGMLSLMAEIIRRKTQYAAFPFAAGKDAVDYLRKTHQNGSGRKADVRLVVTDLVMPGMNGEDLLDEIRKLDPGLPVMIVTSHGSIDSAVDLVRRGAADYLTKPFKPVEFIQRIDRILENCRLQEENTRLKAQLRQQNVMEEIIGSSKPMADTLKIVSTAALSDALVMIYGEGGTGKELIARAIHALSARASGKFVTVNCGALPDTLLENELFGHVKGAYSDAHSDQLGLVEEASGGT
ncbi:MAG: sigma-54-dependent Fis family transcriptional regulator, partial [Candidatus Riflebacteria bacterium]|nr:sigma-54-dependent Fis family transcriptional regulator [Candidatus Riflebacteria bacterium]